MATPSLRTGDATTDHPPAGGAVAAERPTDNAAPLGERELIEQAKAGSVDAFSELARRYEGTVLSLLRFRLRPEIEAEDVAQDTFIRAWTNLLQFDETRPFKPWLLTIAVRTAIAHNRSARSRKSLLDRLSITPQRSAGGGAATGFELGEGASIWDVAYECLSEESAGALWLRYGEDMSMREIGESLGRTEVHIRVILLRARRKLRDRLALDSTSELVGGQQ